MRPPDPADDIVSMTDIAHAMAMADGGGDGDRMNEWQRRRQQLLDALPIAAGLYAQPPAPDGGEGGDIVPICCNMRMEQILSGRGGRVDATWITRRMATFLAADEESEDLDWHDDEVGQRHFAVRIHRLARGDDGSRRCVVSLVDRTAQVETERSLRTEMLHDSLTGLPNRLAFNEAVEEAIGAGGESGDYAVLVCDLTRFSRINECMGSMAGDELIITVARRLIASLRDGDILARLGGDEFAILLRLNDGSADALQAARRINATFSTPVRLSDLEIRVDCAVGCATSDARVTNAADLIRNAQIALKRAKRSGDAELYQIGETNAARRRFSLETELRRAIERGDLTLAYQPLIDLDDGTVSGFEALARWTPEGLPPVPPFEFIPVAEESGLIVPLGRWALDTAARTLADWDRAAGRRLPIRLSVNVSPVQLHRDNVAALVDDALGRHGVDGARLTLELTESSIIADPDRALHVVSALKALDCAIAMDDFGTGYSSLALLQKLPIDILKIDRSFVSGMLGDRDAVAIVRAVLSLADALGMKTTAEGVETVELAQTLTALGCTTGQGYYWAKPLPAEQAFAYLVQPRA